MTAVTESITAMQNTLQTAMTEMTTMNSILESLKSEISAIKEAQAHTEVSVKDAVNRLDEADRRISGLEDDSAELKGENKTDSKNF